MTTTVTATRIGTYNPVWKRGKGKKEEKRMRLLLVHSYSNALTFEPHHAARLGAMNMNQRTMKESSQAKNWGSWKVREMTFSSSTVDSKFSVIGGRGGRRSFFLIPLSLSPTEWFSRADQATTPLAFPLSTWWQVLRWRYLFLLSLGRRRGRG